MLFALGNASNEPSSIGFILIASRIPPGLLSALGLTILFCMGVDMNIDMEI